MNKIYTEKRSVFFLFVLVLLIMTGVLFFRTDPGFAWGGGHDFIAEILRENIPADLQDFFGPEDKQRLIDWSHYPDEPYKSPDDIEKIIGKRDVDLMIRNGLRNSGWMHSNMGQVCSLAGLVLAFREKNSRRAAFYISELSHSLSDEGALNHTPMNNYLECIVTKKLAPIPYDQLKDVSMNPSDLGSCGPVARKRISENIKNYKPKILAECFSDFLYKVMLTEGDAGAMASHVEEAVTYAKDPEARICGFVEIGTWQISLLLDVIETARHLGASNCPVEIPNDFKKTLHQKVKERITNYDIRNDSYCRDFFDESKTTANSSSSVKDKDPSEKCLNENEISESKNNKTDRSGFRSVTVGLVLEPYSYWSSEYRSLSFLGALLTSGAGRTLRDAGCKIVPLNLPAVAKFGLPKAEDVPLLILSSGRFQVDSETAAYFRTYLQQGGKIIWIGGNDPCRLTGAIAQNFRMRKNEEIPVSTKWSLQNEDVLADMTITFDGPMKKSMGNSGYKFYKNPNINGFAKPRCQVSIDLPRTMTENIVGAKKSDKIKRSGEDFEIGANMKKDGKSGNGSKGNNNNWQEGKGSPEIVPLAWLDNGKENFCIAAATDNIVWLPEYLVSPYTLSQDDRIGYFPQMRLDSFGRSVILNAAEYLIGQ